ncbi:MAG: ABC transporter substrate-binding protein [Bifidobacterium sp.]|jgi:peptide/nickel transport system substrate-binding protein
MFRRTGLKLAAISLSVAMTAGMAACGSGASSGASSQSADDSSLTIAKPDGSVGSENNNPFIADSSGSKLGYINAIYEPLGVMDLLDPSRAVKPRLASSIVWSADYKTLTLTARQGVKWSDGQAFTAADIAYTFQLFIDHPELDLNSLNVASSTSTGKTATITFKNSMYVNQDKVIHKLIIPKHIWEKQSDLSSFKNENPVGTGPYALKQFSSESTVLTARTDYWGGTPAVKTLYYQSYNDNTMLVNALANGDVDWSQMSQPPNVDTYLSKDRKHNKNWAPTALSADILYMNTTKAPFNDPAFRKAVSMVVDRQKHAKIAREGIVPVITSITGLPTPAGNDFIASKYKNQKSTVNIAGAKKVLINAGYTYQGGKLMKNGKQVSFELSVPQGWTDYVTGISLISDELKAIGVDAKTKTPDTDTWTENVGLGKFDAILHWIDTGSTAYDFYSDTMDGRWYSPVGKTASYNFGRYNNQKATDALNTYANTTDASARKQALETLETLWVDETPAISVGNRPLTVQYNTRKFVGWPSSSNPYVAADPTMPTTSYLLMQLKPAK